MPPSTPAPLHDIAGPVAFFPYPLWMVVLAGVVLLALLAGLVWLIFFRKRRTKEETSRERARRALGDLRGRVATTEVYEFSIGVSDVLRRFIEETRGIRVTRQTSMEFLAEVEGRKDFSADERGALAAFLERADLIKFARVHAGVDDSRALLESADQFVAGGGGAEVAGRSAVPADPTTHEEVAR